CRHLSAYARDGADLDEEAMELRTNGRTRRVGLMENFAVHLVELVPVGDVGEVRGDGDDVVECGAGGREKSTQVLEHLARLCADAVRHVPRRRVARDLAGDEDGVARDDRR